MELGDLQRILTEMEPGMSLVVPMDWVSLNIEGKSETERDLTTIELATSHDCTWERDPAANMLTFAKQVPAA